MGALNDHLLPFIEEPSEINLIVKKNPGAGVHTSNLMCDCLVCAIFNMKCRLENR